MTLIKHYSVDKLRSVEELEEIKLIVMKDLLASIADHDIELDRPYSIVVKDSAYEPINQYCPGVEQRKMAVNIERVAERRIRFVTPEESWLKPQSSLRKKLKNCWKYLRDDADWKVITEEVK